MNKFVLVVFALLSKGLLCAQTKIFIAADNSFSVTIPAEWATASNRNAALVATDPSFPEGRWEVEVYTARTGKQLTLDELSKEQLKNFQSSKPGADKLNAANFQTINQKKWWVVDYTSSKGTRYICFQIIEDQTRYSIYYFSKEAYFGAGVKATDELVSSFKTGSTEIVQPAAKDKPSTEKKENHRGNSTAATAWSTSDAGKVAPDAKKMEVNKMEVFHGKYASVSKGTEQALMNDAGELVIPFGKYNYYPGGSYWLKNVAPNSVISNFGAVYPSFYGTLAPFNAKATPTKFYGVYKKDAPAGSENAAIGPDGKILPVYIKSIDHEGYSSQMVKQNTNTYPIESDLISERYDGAKIVGAGNRRQLRATGGYETIRYNFESTSWSGATNGYSGWAGGLRPASKWVSIEVSAGPGTDTREAKNKKIGFINRKGAFQVPPNYYKVGEFSEGIAFVCRLDEFGEERWGAIDTVGNLIIPFQYRIQPGRFNNGRALVQAINMDKVAYAMINREGNIVFTLPKNSGDTLSVEPWCCNPLPEKFLYSHGYTFVAVNLKTKGKDWGHLLDTNGVYIPIMKKLRAHFTKGESVEIISPVRNNEFLFTVASNTINGIGIADITGKIILPPVFSNLSLFEPESKLQYAEVGKQYVGQKGIEGYIDRTGIFRIVKVDRAGGF